MNEEMKELVVHVYVYFNRNTQKVEHDVSTRILEGPYALLSTHRITVAKETSDIAMIALGKAWINRQMDEGKNG